MEIKDIALLITATASIIGVTTNIIYQRITYTLQKSKENENELFKMKLIACGEILDYLYKIENMLNTTYLIMKGNPEKKTSEEILKFADEFDLLVDAFDNCHVRNSLVFGDNVSIQIDKIVIHLYKKNSKIIEKDVAKLKEFIDDFFNSSNELSELMREELEMEDLNIKLYKRIKI